MDNADEIMIVTLRQIGCIIPEEMTTLQQFTPEVFMPVCCTVLNTIDSTLDLPSFVPSTGPEKFKHGSNITKALKKVGYREECGYHLFLYPNEADTKKIISFLVERLPRTDQRSEKEEIVGSGTIVGQLKSQVRVAFTQPWLLPVFQKPRPFDHFSYHFTNPITSTFQNPDDVDEYFRELNQKTKGGKDLLNLNLRLNAISLLKRNIQMSSLAHLSTFEDSSVLRVNFPEGMRNRRFGRFAHATLFTHEKGNEEVDLNAAATGGGSGGKDTRESQIQALQDSIDVVNREINDLQREIEEEMARTEKIQTSVASMHKDSDKLEEEVKVASLLATLLPDVDNSILKLNALNEKVIVKIRQNNAEWETHRAAFVVRYHNLIDETRGKKSESYRLTEKIKEIRREMGGVVEDAKSRQMVLKQLKEEYEGMNKSANRSVYMKKVNDMHCNLSQQRVDIDNLITDMRTLMTETTLAEERLGRAFKEAEVMLSAAYEQNKKDEAYGAIYKRFNNFDQNYTELCQTYEHIGVVLNQLLDMDERILDQGRFETDKKIGRVRKDYDEIKKENLDLRSKIDVLK